MCPILKLSPLPFLSPFFLGHPVLAGKVHLLQGIIEFEEVLFHYYTEYTDKDCYDNLVRLPLKIKYSMPYDRAYITHF